MSLEDSVSGELLTLQLDLQHAAFRWLYDAARLDADQVARMSQHILELTASAATASTPAGRLNLLDFGCIRVFPPAFVGGVVTLFRALCAGDRAGEAAAYRAWGFKDLTEDLMDVLGIWARFIYAPLLDDRVRTVADGISPGAYGRREAFQVKRALDEKGPVTIPREFVFMDRAAIGLGAAFLHLGAELNWRRLFEASLEGFSEEALAERQAAALGVAGLS